MHVNLYSSLYCDVGGVTLVASSKPGGQFAAVFIDVVNGGGIDTLFCWIDSPRDGAVGGETLVIVSSQPGGTVVVVVVVVVDTVVGILGNG